jgi:dTDP-4-amino-4,6-dideoxygalactose transaminase
VLTAGVEELGYKMNFTDLQASIGRVQLARMEEMQSIRLRVARRYAERLRDVRGVTLQAELLADRHARHLFVIRLDAGRLAEKGLTRDALLRELRARNIGASVHYPPLHGMPLYADCSKRRLPVTEEVASQLLTLPISASMSDADTDYVADHLLDILQ